MSFCLLSTLIHAQNIRVDFNDGEFFLLKEEYEESLYAFGQVYKEGYEDNAYLNYRMGQSLINIHKRETESIPYFERAVQSISTNVKEGKFGEEHAPPDAHLYLGNAYRINMETDKALEHYHAFTPYISPKDDILQAYVDQQIAACSKAVVEVSSPAEIHVGNLGQLRETHSSMYNIQVSGDFQTMAFMGVNPFYNGIYVAVKNGEVWDRPMNITPSVASDGNMDVVDLSYDGKKMLLAVADEFSSNIYESVYSEGRWHPAQSLGKPINTRYYEGHACYSEDGRSIYFSSNRQESMGGMDIFRSDLQEDGSWGEPVNLGPAVNTILNEDAPRMSPDGKQLYFSSQGHSTLGGYDVFYVELLEDGSLSSAPVNLGYPMNTSDDDYTFSPEGYAEDGYSYIFSQGMLGDYDLFRFEMIDVNQTPVPVSLDEPAMPEPPVAREEEPEPEPEVLVPSRYNLRPIYFDFDSYELSLDDIAKLDSLTSILQKYRVLEIEISGYTDSKGSYEYNQQLSVNRAIAVSKYLILNGIDKERIIVKGMSESHNVARNTTMDNQDAPEGRMLNRRAEFRVSLMEDVIVEMEKPAIPDYLKLDE